MTDSLIGLNKLVLTIGGLYLGLLSIIGTFSVGHQHPWVFFLWLFFVIPGTLVAFFSHYCAAYLFTFLLIGCGAMFIGFAEEISKLANLRNRGFAKTLGALFAIVATLITFSVGLFGPGGAVSYAERPFGIGPLTKSGLYCTTVKTFDADIYSLHANPSTKQQKEFIADYKRAEQESVDSNIRGALLNFASVVSMNDRAQYPEAVHQIDNWINNHCGSWTYKWPYDANSPYHGVLGAKFH